ncbi:hypothetical protein DZF91_36315 [Actinomadura logoneensis]|uniref:GerMN domain-containing protein n=1 Tax=Actinomadura logoneensis TaxID=2293572 RepID=A0A372J9X7_9ACTN|nr:hypothetical protein DZF91_36315 [Actinomadura logoneensis]
MATGLTGCGVRETDPIQAGGLPRVTAQPNQVVVYLVRDGRLARVFRPGLLNQPYLGLQQLTVRPPDAEIQRGYRTLLPAGVTLTADPSRIDQGGLLTVRVNRANVDWPRLVLAQVVCTANAAPNVRMVRLDYPIVVLAPQDGTTPSSGSNGTERLFERMASRYTCDQFADQIAG